MLDVIAVIVVWGAATGAGCGATGATGDGITTVTTAESATVVPLNASTLNDSLAPALNPVMLADVRVDPRLPSRVD